MHSYVSQFKDRADVLNKLRFFPFRDENQQLTEDYKRITEQFRDLQRKSR